VYPNIRLDEYPESMPIYEYEPDERNCFMCDGRVNVIQSVSEDALSTCPDCGLAVRRVISQVSFKMNAAESVLDRAGRKGFTAWKRVEEGKWEKVSGEGVDMIVGTPEDIAAVKEEKKSPTKKIDLDQP